MNNHECKRNELVWRKRPYLDSNGFSLKGKCSVCGKEYERVFIENEGIWDPEKGDYVYL